MERPILNKKQLEELIKCPACQKCSWFKKCLFGEDEEVYECTLRMPDVAQTALAYRKALEQAREAIMLNKLYIELACESSEDDDKPTDFKAYTVSKEALETIDKLIGAGEGNG